MFAQVIVLGLVAVAAAQYGYGGPSYHAPEPYAHHGNSYDHSYDQPQPYSFGYDVKDDYGATQSRQESDDGYGNKKGSYSYTDGYGVYRQVDYVADKDGFRATVKTNEPGTDNQDPADVQIHAEPAKYDAPKAYGSAPYGYSRPSYGAPAYSAPSYGSSYGAPAHHAPSYGAPSYRPQYDSGYHGQY